LPVLPFSTNAIFILFIFCNSIIHLLTKYNTLMLNAKLQLSYEITIEIGVEFVVHGNKPVFRPNAAELHFFA